MIALAITMSIFVGLLVGYWLCMSPYSQIFGYFPWHANTSDKIVALTFDDGPNEPFTSQILDILKKRGVRATFFQVGHCASRYPELTKRVYKEGHTVGNHSLSHSFYKYFTSLGFRDEIEQTQDILSGLIGRRPALYRSPWLWRQPFLLRTVRSLGLVPVSGVFCHPLEPFQIDGQKIARTALSRIQPGSIIIFHDGHDDSTGDRSQTVSAVNIVITELQQRGYSFVSVDELLGVPAYLPA